ncbi:MAG: hypothetical protein K8R85_00465, partial [Bacteroidetes bacterium]|nr:hypothetical protein [Bacteroidota bacterium]
MKNILLLYTIILAVHPIYTLLFKTSIPQEPFACVKMNFASKNLPIKSECNKVQLFKKADFPVGVAI